MGEHLAAPVDGRLLDRIRRLFGALMAIGTVRYAYNGWIDGQLTGTEVRFPWPGLEWVTPLPGFGTHVVFGVMLATSIALALGYKPRVAAGLFALCFTWVELIDRCNYLNHYYLVSLLAVLLAVLPTGRTVPLWAYRVVQYQFGLVWIFAGLAKLNADWLGSALPLGIWLPAHADLPIVGPVLAAPIVAFAFSWGGAVFDLTAPFLLSACRTRKIAFAVAIVFHLTVWALFPIGIFSPLMLLGALAFFAPCAEPDAPRPALPRRVIIAAAIWFVVQLLVPMRFALYPGPVNWREEGFRFAWRVMLIEKVGQVEYRIDAFDPPAHYTMRTLDDLSPLQRRMVATQPDLVHAYALHLARSFREHHGRVEVRADAIVAYNGRPAAPFIDPDFDLASIPESLRAAPYILPRPEAASGTFPLHRPGR